MRRGAAALIGALALQLALPASAPAGTLVFSSQRDAAQGFIDYSYFLWRIEDDGTGLRRLTYPREGPYAKQSELDPAWSPDGRLILFFRVANTSTDYAEDEGLQVMGADGGGSTEIFQDRLPDHPYNQFIGARWSPDASGIFYTGFTIQPNQLPSYQFDVRFLGFDGSERTVVGGPGNESLVGFSPEGDRLIVSRAGVQGIGDEQAAPGTGFDTGVYSFDLQGQDPRRLTTGWAPLPIYSPDGRYVAWVSSGPDYRKELWTMRSDGTDVRVHTGNKVLVRERLVWSPHGPTVFFVASSDLGPPDHPDSVIFKLDVSRPDRGPVQVTPSGGVEFEFDWTGGPRAEPVRFRDRGEPAVVLADRYGRPLGPDVATAAAGGKRGRPAVLNRRKLGFFATDVNGVRAVSFALARPAGRRRGARLCRFLRGARFGPPRPCARPTMLQLRRGGDLKALLKRVPKGAYLLGFKSRDFEGNGTGTPRLRPVRIR